MSPKLLNSIVAATNYTGKQVLSIKSYFQHIFLQRKIVKWMRAGTNFESCSAARGVLCPHMVPVKHRDVE